MSKSEKWAVATAITMALSLLGGCRDDAPQVLGTLEYDRISLPAPSAERIVSVDVREGDTVKAGATLLTLERTRIAAQTDVALAQAQQQRESLAELEAGSRDEQIAQARAQLVGANADYMMAQCPAMCTGGKGASAEHVDETPTDRSESAEREGKRILEQVVG